MSRGYQRRDYPDIERSACREVARSCEAIEQLKVDLARGFREGK